MRVAGLEERCARIGRVTKEDLLREMDRVAGDIGAMPDRGQLARMARFRIATYHGHIGGWEDVVSAYRAWKGKRKSEPVRPRVSEAGDGKRKMNAGGRGRRARVSRWERRWGFGG
jgi:hypothetical protein